MAHNTHSGTHPGKRVRLKLKNGDVIVRKFVKTEGKVMFFETEEGAVEEIRRDTISSFSIYKPTK